MNEYEGRARLVKAMRMVDAAVKAGATPEIALDVDWVLAAKAAEVNDPSDHTIQLATRMLRDRTLVSDPFAGLAR